MRKDTPAVTRLLTAEDVAKLLGRSPDAIYRLVRKGLIGGVVRMGRNVRFHPGALEDWFRTGGKSDGQARETDREC